MVNMVPTAAHFRNAPSALLSACTVSVSDGMPGMMGVNLVGSAVISWNSGELR